MQGFTLESTRFIWMMLEFAVADMGKKMSRLITKFLDAITWSLLMFLQTGH